uniref:FkbM family methyltransferase n=1 Tax=Candidatus Planktophila dulcis TaxID=1884914 RepID=UPI003CEF0449
MYKEIIQKGKTPFIVDAGAYIGVTSFFFTKAFPTASILAIEPSAQNYAMLEKNSRELPNIRVVNAAVGPKGKALKVTDPDMGEWGYRTELIQQGDESLPTHSIQFGDLPNPSKSQFPFICKLDIEGAEQYLNESDWDEIMKYSIVIIEPHDWMLPGKHTSSGFMAAHSKSQDPRDIVLVGENIWSIAINSTRAI